MKIAASILFNITFILFFAPLTSVAAPACKLAIVHSRTAKIEKELAHLVSELQIASAEDRAAIRELLHSEIAKKVEEYFKMTGQKIDIAAILKKYPKIEAEDSSKARRGESKKFPVRSVEVIKHLKSTLKLQKFESSANDKIILWDGKFYDSSLNEIPGMNEAYTIMNTWVPTGAHDIRFGSNHNSNTFTFSSQHQGALVFDQKTQKVTRLGQGDLFKGQTQSNNVAEGENGIFQASVPEKAHYIAVYHNHQDRLAIWNPKTNTVDQVSKEFTKQENQANHVNALDSQVLVHYFEQTYLYDLNAKKGKKLKKHINPTLILLPRDSNILAIEQTDVELNFQIRSSADFNVIVREFKMARPNGWWDIVGSQIYGDKLFIQSKRANGNQVTATVDLKSFTVEIQEGLKYYLGQDTFLKQASLDKNRFGHYHNDFLIYGDKVVPTPIKVDDISIDLSNKTVLIYERTEGLKLLRLPN